MMKADAMTVRVVELKGYEYARVSTLARSFDMSRRAMEELVQRLSEGHQVRVLTVGERSRLVNVADFHRALVDAVPVRNGLLENSL